MTNNLPRMRGDQGYSIGFFCGCLVGAMGTYLAFTPQGQQLKRRIIKEYQTNQQLLSLESLQQNDQSVPDSHLIRQLKSIIANLRQSISEIINQHPDQSQIEKVKKIKTKHYFKKK